MAGEMAELIKTGQWFHERFRLTGLIIDKADKIYNLKLSEFDCKILE